MNLFDKPYETTILLPPSAEGKLVTPADVNLVIDLPHAEVRKEYVRHLLGTTLGIPESEWAEGAEFLCYVNGDYGTREGGHMIAEKLRDPNSLDGLLDRGLIVEAEKEPMLEAMNGLVIGLLVALVNRAGVDFNRDILSGGSEMTPAVQKWVAENHPAAAAIALEIHQRALHTVEPFYQAAVQEGRHGVLQFHSYMPLDVVPHLQDNWLADLLALFRSKERFQKALRENKRADILLFEQHEKTGEVLGDTEMNKLLLQAFHGIGISDVQTDTDYQHKDGAECTRKAKEAPGMMTTFEIARDLMLEDRADYRRQMAENWALELSSERMDALTDAVVAAQLRRIVQRNKAQAA